MAVTLVLRALGLGDLLTAVPALRALRRHREQRLVLAAPAALAPLLPLTAAVDELLPTPGLGELHWQASPPDLAVNLHGSGPQSTSDLLAARPRALLTHRHPDRPEVEGPAWRPDLHEVDRWCALLEWHDIPADRDDLTLAEPAVTSPAPGAVVVHPGAAYPARRWPPRRFAAVAAELAHSGHEVVVTGNVAERPLATEVARRAGLPADAVLAGHDLGSLAALVSKAALVVCGDTGVGHLATGYGTPSVLLFGPTPPALWGPPEARSRHVALWAGHTGDPHGRTPDPGLLRLTTDEVLAAARGQLWEVSHV
ncbi:ADP-heptose:LPS heptosyltransferase [Saccharomonospora amisosensis]|uniref:ADP-heptose:LPS heptosyltransferase n=1 Tax=Saccharomonospora amisosensis TaxID=1128677 RepID=A0A7X5USN6_9PSEU|nr:glycosyltransferase family 9 protein [Saccharomonospora amisosensis]NIJ13410.1 ADP-heptose:LPS heptosyltransferase [Saccharomonospora amisosensis]